MRNQLTLMQDLQTSLMGQFDLLHQQVDEVSRRQVYTEEQMNIALVRLAVLESMADNAHVATNTAINRLQSLESRVNTAAAADAAAAVAEASAAPAAGGVGGGTTATEPKVEGTAPGSWASTDYRQADWSSGNW